MIQHHPIIKPPALRRAGGSLLLAFALAAPPTNAAAVDLTREESYWKTNIVDAVIALRPCPATGICGEIVWTNPSDRKLQSYFGDPGRAGDENLCGYSPRIDFKQVAPNRWKGTMEMRGYNINANMDVTLTGTDTLHVKASKFIFSETDTWQRVAKNDPRYPQCKP